MFREYFLISMICKSILCIILFEISFTQLEKSIEKCDVCLDPLDNKSDTTDAWGNKFHKKHIRKINYMTKGICTSCSRIVSELTTNGGQRHIDGRLVCNICKSDAISPNNKNEIEKSRFRVLNQLNNKGFEGLFDKKIPIKIVNKNILMSLKPNSPDIKGLCKAKIQNQDEKQNNEYIIYILDELPKDAFDAVLAHEYLHVWLFDNNLEYNSPVTEGFCNLGTFAIYDSLKTDFSKIQLEIMDKNSDPDYGEGYKKMRKCLNQKGWESLINDIKKGSHKNCNI